MKLPDVFEVKIEKMVPSGEGVGFFKSHPVFLFGVLPDELVLVRPAKIRRGEIKATLVEIIEASPERRAPKEDHFLSCSPWQIIPEKRQRELKKMIVMEDFLIKIKKEEMSELKIEGGDEFWHYRNKMEFSFVDTEKGVSLAFHRRFKYRDLLPLEKCVLAREKINECAEKIIFLLRQKNIFARSLKSLIMRYSYKENKCLAVLYVVEKDFPIFDINEKDFLGWLIIYSDPLSPASVSSEIIFSSGYDYIFESVGGLSFKYFYDGFFQTNPLVFEKLIAYLRQNIIKGKILVDLYSGVGTLGLALAEKFEKVKSVEFDLRACAAAEENIKLNGLKNIFLFSGAAEKQDLATILNEADTLVVDPPRSGLHPKVVKKILESNVKNFIYVSCNPSTQAHDFALLAEKYTCVSRCLFDLYPQTPHVESVMILKSNEQ